MTLTCGWLWKDGMLLYLQNSYELKVLNIVRIFLPQQATQHVTCLHSARPPELSPVSTVFFLPPSLQDPKPKAADVLSSKGSSPRVSS
jgi:hypothetical protein